MAEALKQQFGPAVVRRIAQTLPVDHAAFVAECLDGFEDLELMARGRRVADVMRRHLDPDPARAVEQVEAAIGEDLGFGYFAHSSFIRVYGLPAFEESMAAQYLLTQVFTAEFSIRPFINQYPQTLDRLHQWATDPSEHVRRLVSEGTRPRLPWATRLTQFQNDPDPVIELLDVLKDDESAYVIRSVGNNLNDISRDHPQRALEVASAWAPGRPALVRRGLRTLIKAADPRALEILGYAPVPVTVSAPLPAEVRIGEKLQLTLNLEGHGRVLVDIRMHFPRPSGRASVKVYRGGEVEVDGRAEIHKTISFEPMTTRSHHPGLHRVEAIVNAVTQPLGEFLLIT